MSVYIYTRSRLLVVASSPLSVDLHLSLFLFQSFVVRNSQKARYALSVRLDKEDLVVKHFLIQTNQQRKFVTRQLPG